ncbi:hypothetical protein JHN49_05490 [Streptomyces sp. MBT57]|nr:hypothetical protein [Streptomyces sp. MBT57]
MLLVGERRRDHPGLRPWAVRAGRGLSALRVGLHRVHGVAWSTSWAIELLPEETGGRGISVIYRFNADLDAALILWLIAGP